MNKPAALFFRLSFIVLTAFCFRPAQAETLNPVEPPADQTVWAVWTSPAGSGNAVFAGKRQNTRWEAPTMITPSGAGITAPSVAVDGAGVPWAAWSGKNGADTAIFFSRLGADGKWTQPQQLDPADATSDTTPALVFVRADLMACVWAGFDGIDDEIYFSTCGTDGRWTKPANVSKDDAFPDVDPALAALKDGSVLAVWSGYDGRHYQLMFSVLDSATGTWSEEQPVAAAPTAQELPFFAPDTHGNVRLFWLEAGSYRVCLWKDGRWEAPAHAQMSNDYYDFLSALSADFGGRAWIAWGGSPNASIRYNISVKTARTPLAFRERSSADPVFAAVGLDDLNALVGFFMPSAQAQTATTLDTAKIIALGDSITAGWKGETYESRLATILGRPVVNEGVPGERTSGGLSRVREVLERNLAGTILIWEGTNDVGDGRSAETIAFNLGRMCDIAREIGTTPYLGTILPRNDIFNDRVKDTNPQILNTASSKNVTVAQQYNAFKSLDLSTVYEDNRLHPNAAGYDIAASVWASVLSGGGGGGGGCGRISINPDRPGVNFLWLVLIGLWLAFGAGRRNLQPR